MHLLGAEPRPRHQDTTSEHGGTNLTFHGTAAPAVVHIPVVGHAVGVSEHVDVISAPMEQ